MIDRIGTHWEGCWRFHEDCHPRCQVCGQIVERMELWQEPTDDGLVLGHRTCLNDLVADPACIDGPDVVTQDRWAAEEEFLADPEPQPTDGPDYHEDHAAWVRRNDGEVRVEGAT